MSTETLYLEKHTISKVTKRLVPFLMILYITAFIDRANLGYAALQMNKTLALTSEMFGVASGIFFISYFLLEIPSNVVLEKIGARKWIARILVTWGIAVVITGFVQNAIQLYLVRFFLGACEAGFFPGIILYLTYWFREKERAKTVAQFMTAIAISYIIGAPVSTWIMDHITLGGLEGWRWMFVFEGIPAIILGVITFYYLTDRPEQSKWLTDEEKNWLINELEREKSEKARTNSSENHRHLLTLKNPKVWYLALIYFAFNGGVYGIGFYLPTIIKSFSNILTTTQIGLVAMIPYIIGALVMNISSRHSDRTGERRNHAAVALLVGFIGFLGSGITSNPFISILMMGVAVAGMYSFYGPFWSLATQYLSTAAAAVGIATINSIGNLSGFAGPYAIGVIMDKTNSVSFSLFFLSSCLLIASLLLFGIKKNQLNSKTQANNDMGA